MEDEKETRAERDGDNDELRERRNPEKDYLLRRTAFTSSLFSPSLLTFGLNMSTQVDVRQPQPPLERKSAPRHKRCISPPFISRTKERSERKALAQGFKVATDKKEIIPSFGRMYALLHHTLKKEKEF